MKTFTAILLALLSTSTLFAQKDTYKISAIAFYNLENLFHPSKEAKKFDGDFTPSGSYKYTKEIYHKKLNNLSSVISEIATQKVPSGPSIIGVAEVENARVLKDLIKKPLLRKRNYKIIHFESPDIRGIDVALLYNPQHFKVLNAKAHHVDISTKKSKEHTRDILQVTGILLGDTLSVLVGHWPSRRGGEAASAWKRKAAAKKCLDIKNGIISQNPNARIVIMGDLNDDPVSPSVKEVLKAKGKRSKVQKGGLYNPFYRYFKKGIGTLGYSDSWNLFDQIIISHGFINKRENQGLKFLSAHIHDKSHLKNQFGKFKGYPFRSFVGKSWNGGYSDHFPTYIFVYK